MVHCQVTSKMSYWLRQKIAVLWICFILIWIRILWSDSWNTGSEPNKCLIFLNFFPSKMKYVYVVVVMSLLFNSCVYIQQNYFASKKRIQIVFFVDFYVNFQRFFAVFSDPDQPKWNDIMLFVFPFYYHNQVTSKVLKIGDNNVP